MKHLNKKIAFILCVLSCAILAAGCSMSLTKQNKNFDRGTLKKNANSVVKEWFSTDYSSQLDQYQQAIEYYDGMKDSFSDSDWESYQTQRAQWVEQIAEFKENAKLKKKYGDEKKKNVGKPSYTINSESATVTMTVLTNQNKKLNFSVSYDEEGNQTGIRVEAYKSTGQKMAKAGLNTVMSMAIVFAVLFFIACIIKTLKLLGTTPGDKADDADNARTAAIASDAQAEPACNPVNPACDSALVAVITAAIVAAEEMESADGLVIRSIVRR